MNVRAEIERVFHEVMQETGSQQKSDLNDQTVLLDSGLDSLGFAILVARLDEELGYDPFTVAEQAYYPTTFGEFVAFYEKNRPESVDVS